MADFFLRIYDLLRCRKGLAALIVAVIMALCVISMCRLHYEEDIAGFLPIDCSDSRQTEFMESVSRQNSVAVIFRGRDNASDDEIISFYRQIRDALEGKNYKILYLKAEDVRGNLDVIRKERSDEEGNELWFPLMMGFYNDSLFSKENGLSGEEDLINHFIHRQDLELRICKEVFEGKYTVLNSKNYTENELTDI